MTVSRGVSLRDTVAAAGAATAAALLMGVTLAAVSRPTDFRARLATVETDARRAQAEMQPLPGGSLYSADAVCRRDLATAAKGLRDSLAAFATQAGLTLDVVDIRPEEAGGQNGLAPMRLRFTATGSYEAVVMLLAALSRQRPDIFADGVDLTAKISNVTLSFSGRAFCAA